MFVREASRALPYAAGALLLAALGAVAVAASAAETAAASPIPAPGAYVWALRIGVVVAAGAYAASVVLAARGRLSVRVAVVVAAVAQLAPLAAPLLLSSDAYSYWMYGRIGAVHDGNPYADTPREYAGDPAFERMGATWHDTTIVYGPAFALLVEGQAAATGESPDAAAWTWKAVAAASMLAVVGLTTLLARRRAFAAAFVGWNPLLALHFAGGGHNDALMIALVLAALYASTRGRETVAGAAWAVAAAIKWVPLVLLPLVAAEARRNPRRLRSLLVGIAAAGVVIAAASFARYGTAWLEVFFGLSEQARRTGSLGLARPLDALGLDHRATVVVLAGAFALVYAWLVREAWRGRPRLALAAGAFAIAQGWLNPWYALWPLALGAVEEDRLARAIGLGLTAYLLLDVFPK